MNATSSEPQSPPCPQCGAALSIDRMGAYCPSCKQGISEWRTQEASPLISAVARLSAENERLRAALTRIIERYEQTQTHSHGDGALLPLDHWNLPRAMQQEARDALGLGVSAPAQEADDGAS